MGKSILRPGRLFASLALLVSAGLVFYVALAIAAILLTPPSLFPVPEPSYTDADGNYGKITLPSGEEVTAVYLPRSDARYLLLYAHGNREDLGLVRERLEQLRLAGFSVLAVEYPGYGTSPGRPSEEGAYEAFRTLYDYALQELRVPPARVVLYGKALGGSLAIRLASERMVAGIAVESTPVSAFRLVPIARLLPWDHYDSSARLAAVDVPLFIVHGSEDDVIPISQGEEMLSLADTTTLHLWVDGAGHNDVVEVAGEIYWAAFERFMILVEALPP